MQEDFSTLLEQRPLNTEEIESLMWIKEDHGAWDGPLADWINSHKQKILNHCKSFDTVIQAGGNQGMYPRFLSKLFKRVITAEPDYLNFHCLVNNCQKENIVKLNCGFSDENRFISLDRSAKNNTGMFRTIENGDVVPAIKLDTLNVNSLSLIWLERFSNLVEYRGFPCF
jgi:hypothetical protein